MEKIEVGSLKTQRLDMKSQQFKFTQEDGKALGHSSGDTWEMSFGPCRIEQSCYFHAFIINDIVLIHIVKLTLLHLEVKGE